MISVPDIALCSAIPSIVTTESLPSKDWLTCSQNAALPSGCALKIVPAVVLCGPQAAILRPVNVSVATYTALGAACAV